MMKLSIDSPELLYALKVCTRYVCYAVLVVLVYFVLELAAIIGYLSIRFICWLFGRKIEITSKKSILITGATSGIGLLLAKHFYKLGFTIFAAYYNDQEAGYNELLELVGSGGNNKYHEQRLFLIKMDVRSLESIQAASAEVDSILQTYQLELYCLINNAGISKVGPFEWADYNVIKDTVDTNVIGTMLVTRQFLFRIIQCKGRVVNVGSGLAFFHLQEMSVYTASKCAIHHFSESLNYDLANYGATCHCVHPGNFIANTNITIARLKSNDDSRRKLTEEETLVYAKSIESAQKITLGCVRERINRGDDSWRQMATSYTIEIPESLLSQNKLEKRKFKLFKRIFLYVMEMFDGGADDLEKSGILKAYEQVVCHKNPPLRVYAGSSLYMHSFGPYLELTTPLINALWSKLVNYNRFRYE